MKKKKKKRASKKCPLSFVDLQHKKRFEIIHDAPTERTRRYFF